MRNLYKTANLLSEGSINDVTGFSLDLPEMFFTSEAFRIDFIDIFRS